MCRLLGSLRAQGGREASWGRDGAPEPSTHTRGSEPAVEPHRSRPPLRVPPTYKWRPRARGADGHGQGRSQSVLDGAMTKREARTQGWGPERPDPSATPPQLRQGSVGAAEVWT